MGKCKSCGRKGLFFKVNSDGLCKDCVVLAELEVKKQKIEADTEKLKQSINDLQSRYETEREKFVKLEDDVIAGQRNLNTLKARPTAFGILRPKQMRL